MNYRSLRNRVSEFWLDHGRKVIIGTAAVGAVGGASMYFYNYGSPDLNLGSLTSSNTGMETKADIKEPVFPPELKPADPLPNLESTRTHAKKEVRHVRYKPKSKSVKTPTCAKTKSKVKKHYALHKKQKASKGKVKLAKAKKQKNEARTI